MNITITNRVTHDCAQGSDAWHALRAKHFTASEASAMLGVSKYQTRADLLKRKATGLVEEVDAATQRRFDDGHAAEAAARQIVEGIIGDDLYPVTMTADVDGLPLLASMDGLTMLGDTGWETKLLNQDLRADVEAGTLDEHYTVQMEQQLMVAGAERIYFTTTDGTPENTFGVWYESNPALRERIVAGWQQFAKDVAAYVPEPETVKPAGKAPDALPALRIEVTGMVTASNLAAFREHALAVFGGINTDLQTDADFADAERTVKWCKEVEDRLDAAKQHALSQTASIDDLFRTIDAIKEEAGQKRLTLDKLVKAEKENRRAEIVADGREAVRAHVAVINATLGEHALGVPASVTADLATAIKGKKSLASMKDAVDASVAQHKIEASQTAERVRANISLLAEAAGDHLALFADRVTLCATKAPEDLRNLISARIAEHQRSQEARLEAERARIRAEEEAKARAEQEKSKAEEARAAAEAKPVQAPISPAIPMAAGAAPTPAGARLKLGDINAMIAPLSITAEGLAQIGFPSVGTDRAAKLYNSEDLPEMLQRLSNRLSAAIRQQFASR